VTVTVTDRTQPSGRLLGVGGVRRARGTGGQGGGPQVVHTVLRGNGVSSVFCVATNPFQWLKTAEPEDDVEEPPKV
jgi:hypothetical protein